MLTAWGFAGVSGPTLIAAVRQSTGNYVMALELIAGVMLASTILTFVIRAPGLPGTDLSPADVQRTKQVLHPIR